MKKKKALCLFLIVIMRQYIKNKYKNNPAKYIKYFFCTKNTAYKGGEHCLIIKLYLKNQ